MLIAAQTTLRDLKREKELETELSNLHQDHVNLQERYQSLSEDHQAQNSLTNDIRTEASNLLLEIEKLTLGKQQDDTLIQSLQETLEGLETTVTFFADDRSMIWIMRIEAWSNV